MPAKVNGFSWMRRDATGAPCAWPSGDPRTIMLRQLLLRTVALPAIALLVSSSCGGGDERSGPCPFSCPAAQLSVILAVTSMSDGGTLSGVKATLSGPVTDEMSCEPNGSGASCTWGDSESFTIGDYSLEVSAFGFQSANVAATITMSDAGCECRSAAIKPSVVILDPS